MQLVTEILIHEIPSTSLLCETGPKFLGHLANGSLFEPSSCIIEGPGGLPSLSISLDGLQLRAL